MPHAVVLISATKAKAMEVQEVISAYAHLIKARMGFHESMHDAKSELMILHVKPVDDADKLVKSLQEIDGIEAKLTKI